MIFDKLFGKKSENATSKSPANTSSAPQVSYVHKVGNFQTQAEAEYSYIVLSWIQKKKNGYDLSTNKFPKWFMDTYGVDFNKVANGFINAGYLSLNGSMVKVSPEGEAELKKYSYVLYVHDHPQYCLTLKDFKSSSNLGKVRDSDIAWGIFNQRIISYTQKAMWSSLAANYANMADLLVEEKKYEQALDFIFEAAYIETSGMRDNNELTPIWPKSYGSKAKGVLPNGNYQIYDMHINNYWVTVPFMEIQKNMILDWKEIENRFMTSEGISSLERILPFRYFERPEAFEFFHEAIDAAGKKGIFCLQDLSKRLKTNMPDENSKQYFYASVENKVKYNRH